MKNNGLKMINCRHVVRIVALMLLFACALQGAAFAKEITPKVAVRIDGMGQGLTEVAVNLLPGEYIRVELTAASGTGYEWKLMEEPKLARVEKSGPEQVYPDKNLSGGPNRVIYTLQAGEASGTESLHFVLARPWEDNKLTVKKLSVNMTVNRP